MRKTWITILVIIILIIIGWWIWSASTSNTSQQAAYAPTTGQTTDQNSAAPMIPATSTPAATALLTVATDPALGSHLVATNGMTLYTYAPDTANKSNCIGGCAAAWPPYAVTGPLTGGDGVTGTLSTYTRSDGSTQLTYNGRPLYFFGQDNAPGDTKGQGVGGVWYVAKP